MLNVFCRWLWRLFRSVSRRKRDVSVRNTRSRHLQFAGETDDKEKPKKNKSWTNTASRKRRECRRRKILNDWIVSLSCATTWLTLFFSSAFYVCCACTNNYNSRCTKSLCSIVNSRQQLTESLSSAMYFNVRLSLYNQSLSILTERKCLKWHLQTVWCTSTIRQVAVYSRFNSNR